ncbi:thioredoxin reductase [Thalassobaculum fulvum]|uniref:Thioredoxin reductase n=1 Tax=Thalassobaculum fulvum TaxID=1633335 RepID=A0A918XTD4_9PROT|nr:thioredoxin-disulfide reductase [Thalassobaculum fulvum]GHD54631.1 thioredoxin reductase [Thalassobaculum fulvum]
MAEHRVKVLIIGAGAAGLTAGIYTARANLSPMLVAGLQPGGQMTITSEVENYPGFADVIQGPWLMEQMQKQAENVGTRIVSDVIVDVDFSSRPLRCVGDTGDVYLADAVIVATGAQARWLGLPSEQQFNGRGVSACATCDGFFYRNKDVVVVGGGNTAVEEALYLANICSSVTLVHRRDTLRAEKIMQDRLFRNPKIRLIWDSVVDEVLGGDGPFAGVEAVRIKNVRSGDATVIPAEGLFVAIGHDPATKPFRGHLPVDGEGYLLAQPGSTRTTVPGVFAAGDCVDKVFRQAVTAAGMGCMAALEAERYLAELEDASQAAAAE